MNEGVLDKVLAMIDGSTIELTSKEDIKNVYHQENKTKFAQTIGIPAIKGKLMEDLGS